MRSTIASTIYNNLKSSILNGTLRPNSRLVEETLAAQYKASRTPVREALARLRSEYLVSPTPQGMQVVDPLITQHRRFIIHIHLSAAAAELAALHRTEAQLIRMYEILSDYSCLDHTNYSERVRMNSLFHDTIALASDYPMLRDMLHNSRLLLSHDDAHSFTREDYEEAIDQHKQIVNAISRKDARSASRLTLNHFLFASSVLTTSKAFSYA